MAATRKLTVTALEPIKSGHSANGKEWTLFRVSARGADGRPVSQKLTAFTQLPIGEERLYVVEPYNDGESFTLRLAGGKRPGWRDAVAALDRRVSALEQQRAGV